MLKSRAGHALLVLFVIFCLNPKIAFGYGPKDDRTPEEVDETPAPSSISPAAAAETIFLPVVLHPISIAAASSIPRVNAPSFDGEIVFTETAIFWFGKISPSENYTDVRVGYNASELFVHLAIFDRSVWYNKTPSPSTFSAWDSASLFLEHQGSAYRFDGQLNGWEDRAAYQAAYQQSGGNWIPASIPFSTATGWRGDAPNIDSKDDRGWRITYRIPFSSLGSSGPPQQGAIWNLGISITDRDDAGGSPNPEKRWPEGMDPGLPGSWGELAFGLPAYSPPQASGAETVVIRHGLDGTTVIDGTVGGGTDCGDTAVDTNFFTEWGEANYAGAHQVNVQNQYDLSDWPCFSKVYFTFPMEKIPAGREILSATLTVYQFSNAGGGVYGIPPGSWIQVSRVNQSWDEASLTWNNAPQAWENFGISWVDWIQSPVPWPGVARQWDVSLPVFQAYSAGEPLRLVLYSADSAQHSGKYFVSSDTGDWNEVGRPTLRVTYGIP
jgi:hypothetical protein